MVVQIGSKGEILYSECNCPYDFGPVCKHQVAAYYELQGILKDKPKNNKAKNKSSKKADINQVLNALEKEELIDIIMNLTKKDATLREGIIIKYSDNGGSQEIEQCKKLIKGILRKYRGRGGFIEYGETYEFASEFDVILEKASESKDALLSLDIAFLVLQETIGSFQYADDSDGYIGDLLRETLELIDVIVEENEDADVDKRKRIFDKLLHQSENSIFEGWEEYRIDILRICTRLVDIDSLRGKLTKRIENMISKIPVETYSDYLKENLLLILFEMIDEYGTEEEAEKFIKDNLNFSKFREILIDLYAKKNDYYGVIELAKEGEKKDYKFAGLVRRWQKIRYEAYKKLLLKDEQKELARELFLKGEFEYYNEMKALAGEEEKVLYDSLKQELRKDEGWQGRELFLKLILEENDLDELMQYVRLHPDNIEQYADKLVFKFKDEVVDIYRRFIKWSASSAEKRKHYQEVCRKLNRYKKFAGQNAQLGLTNELRALYKKRPAFIEELDKIK